jgi:hypothetical protein
MSSTTLWILPGGAVLDAGNHEGSEFAVCRTHDAVIASGWTWRKIDPHARKAGCVRYGPFSANYREKNRPPIRGGDSIPLPNYEQLDIHSCSFVAALTVVHHFDKGIPPVDVLKVVRTATDRGVGQRRLIKALRQLGIDAKYRDDLTIRNLRQYVKNGIPVIITVEPPGWVSDHWCVVRGFSKDGKTIWLSNHVKVATKVFNRKNYWFYPGEGLVCTPLKGWGG